jgi:hypothetical protein
VLRHEPEVPEQRLLLRHDVLRSWLPMPERRPGVRGKHGLPELRRWGQPMLRRRHVQRRAARLLQRHLPTVRRPQSGLLRRRRLRCTHASTHLPIERHGPNDVSVAA